METTLDPQLVNFAKAIRQQESGGDFTRKGGSGEYGAYQWIPDTWNAKSREFGVNTPLQQATKEQQNEVAYKTLAQWKQQHPDWNVGNFASAWNAGQGEPNAYKGTFSNGKPSIGKNNFGVQYDVPAYAKAVATYYQQYKKQSPTTTSTDQPQVSPTLETTPSIPFTGDIRANTPEAAQARKDTAFIGGNNFVKDDIANSFNSGINQVKNSYQQGVNATNPLQLLESGTGIATGAINTLFSPLAPVFHPVGQAVNYVADKVGDNPAVQKFAMSKAGQNTSRVVEDVNNLNTVVGGVAGAMEAAPRIKQSIDNLLPKVKNATTKIQLAVNPPKTPEGLTGTITQGEIGDIPASQRTLKNIDASGVKTYQDLNAKLNEKIRTDSQAQDTYLDQSPQPKKLNELKVKTTVGDKTISHNYVQDGIDQLKAYYTKINDVKGLAEIIQLEKKAKTIGLTSKEVNGIARVHGQEITGFNANGEAASGLTKQAAENTRTGIKSTVGEMSGDPKTFKANDKVISDSIHTRDLVQKVSESVNKFQQKIIQRGWGEKIGRYAGKIIDLASGHMLKGAVESFIPRGQGFKMMNALDIEANLSKNLKALQDILNNPNMTEAQATSILKNAQESSQSPNLGNIMPKTKSNILKDQIPAQSNKNVPNMPETIPQPKSKGNLPKGITTMEQAVTDYKNAPTDALKKSLANDKRMLELHTDPQMKANIQKNIDKAEAELARRNGVKAIPEKLNPLAQEAKKYKSAEEFVKNIGDKEIEIPITQIHAETIKENLGKYPSKTKGPIEAVFTNGELKVQDGNHRYYEALARGDKTVKIKFPKEDLISKYNAGGYKIGDILPSGSQLTDFYNKAVGKKSVPFIPKPKSR